jgi:predicted RNA-binding protein with PIN domain
VTRSPAPDGLARLLIDGDNVLHDVRGTRDEGGVAWLLPRLADWRPASLDILVALDGHPAPGESNRPRVARGIVFRHSGSRSADDLIVSQLEAMPYSQRSRTAVVTRDRDLQHRVRSAGGLVRSVDWLMGSISGERPNAGSDASPVGIGQGKPPRGLHAAGADREPDESGPSWSPGRGATRKKGNPRRAAKRERRR